MPIYVARYGRVSPRTCSARCDHSPVKEPRPRIIRSETDSHVVRGAATNGHDIAPDRIYEIRLIATRNPDDIKVVLMKCKLETKESCADHVLRADV